MRRKPGRSGGKTVDRIRRAFLSGHNRPPDLARTYRVPEGTVLAALKGLAGFPVKPSQTTNLLRALTRIPSGRVIIRNPHAVAEMNCSTSQLKMEDGWINLHAGEYHVHIRARDIRKAFFVDNTGHDRKSPAHSIQFFASSGESVFKLFLIRDSKGKFPDASKAAYQALKEEYRAG